MTVEGDLVLVYTQGEPAFFARIEAIDADVKPEWFQVKMLVLQIPLVVITWILREAYINGEEFTMGGRPIRMTKVVAPEESAMEPESEQASRPIKTPTASAGTTGGEKVVSLADRRKKSQDS